jgi:hypothetical protein
VKDIPQQSEQSSRRPRDAANDPAAEISGAEALQLRRTKSIPRETFHI